mgnify:FL=1
MDTVIGLGNAGCNIAEKFSGYSQYDVYRIDTKKRPGKRFKLIPECKTHEEYEQKCPSFKYFFRNIKNSCLVVIGGSGTISGASLRLLEQLKKHETSVLYIRPDATLLSQRARMRENVVFGVLQQYARSALLKKLYIVENNRLEEAVGSTSVMNHYEKLNQLVVSTIHMINFCKNSNPELETFDEPIETARISTFGVCDLESGQESLFFDLQMPREKVYYYMINKQKLEEDGELLKKITGNVRSRSEGNTINTSFGIYSTDYEEDYVYVTASATLVQGQKNLDSKE